MQGSSDSGDDDSADNDSDLNLSSEMWWAYDPGNIFQ